MAPRILPRSEHPISRRNMDPDALKVLYRLKNFGYLAYLVGGGVRDLLLGRPPKDFDIATSAHPNQVKRLFRNCFIVGRRFRLCHVRFSKKMIEVSTFRRLAESEDGDLLIKRDNTFGTPEEDAFRRDFTVNALFYDIATFSVIDYVDGLRDVEARLIRTIGDPGVRFQEDPVRMLRAVALGARLGFSIDHDSLEAIRAMRSEIVKSSPARVLEEFYKILRHGSSRITFERLNQVGLLAYLMPEADQALREHRGEALLSSLERLDTHRQAGFVAPEDLSNAVLAGTLLQPLGISLKRAAGQAPLRDHRREDAAKPLPPDVASEARRLGESEPEPEEPAAKRGQLASLALPFAKRDLNQFRLVLLAQRRLRDVHESPDVVSMLAGRDYLEDSLRWLEIHGGDEGRELALHWRSLDLAPPPSEAAVPVELAAAHAPRRATRGEADEPRTDASPRRRGVRRRSRRPASTAAEPGEKVASPPVPAEPSLPALSAASATTDDAADPAGPAGPGSNSRSRRRRRRRRRPSGAEAAAGAGAPKASPGDPEEQ